MTKLKIYNKDNSLLNQINVNSKDDILKQILNNDLKIYYGCLGGSCGACACSIEKGKGYLFDGNFIKVNSFIKKGLKSKINLDQWYSLKLRKGVLSGDCSESIYDAKESVFHAPDNVKVYRRMNLAFGYSIIG